MKNAQCGSRKSSVVRDTVCELELELHRVGLQVHQAVRSPHSSGSGSVPPCRLISSCAESYRRAQLRLAHAEAAAVVVEAVERPAVAEPEAAHDAADELRGARRAVVVLALHQHRRRARVRLDVVGLVAQPLEAEQVVHGLPDDPGNRDLGHHSEQDELLATWADHARPPVLRAGLHHRRRPQAARHRFRSRSWRGWPGRRLPAPA